MKTTTISDGIKVIYTEENDLINLIGWYYQDIFYSWERIMEKVKRFIETLEALLEGERQMVSVKKFVNIFFR